MNAAPEIPLDIRALLQDCILSLFWPKQKIFEFLESVGCRDETLKSATTGENSLPRHAIVTEAFSRMSARADRGYPVFQTMIDRLSSWSHFDEYWFETTQTLDRAKADEAIANLKNAVSKRNAATENRRTSAASTQKTRSNEADLSALTKAFQKMFGSEMTVQARGRLFERFLQELFNKQAIKMGDPFNINGEQIDGTFKFEGENYIVEAKWQDASTSTGDLYKFAHKVDGKMHGRGMFISVNGYSTEGIRAIVVGKQIQTILMDGEDVNAVLEGRIKLEKMLDYKVRAAQTRGEVYVCAIRQRPKIN
jgi:hypothetical protein